MNAFIQQIFYDEASRQMLDPRFSPLDNRSSPRPEWFEFWPMREFLHSTPLEEDSWYAFLSPKFARKFGLDSAQILSILEASSQTDVVLFSPHWDQIAYFLNPFEQGEFWTPGLLGASQRFLDHVAIDVDARSLVTTSRTTVFSNYFAAKPVFWRRWLILADQLVECSEMRRDGLAAELNRASNYEAKGRPVPLKTFVQERLATLILCTGDLRIGTVDMSDAVPTYRDLFAEDPLSQRRLQSCDLLKRHYVNTRDRAFLDVYYKLRAAIPTVRAVPVTGLA